MKLKNKSCLQGSETVQKSNEAKFTVPLSNLHNLLTSLNNPCNFFIMHESSLQYIEMLQWVDLLTGLVIRLVPDVCEII